MYFLVYSVYGQGVTDFHEKVAKRTMGTKVGWLQMLAKGETEASKIPPETNDLKRLTDAQMFVSTQAMMEIIDTLDTLIKDKRNPLVHSTYYYRVDKWNMSVSQTHNLNFKQIGIMDMRKYSKEIEVIKENLIQLLYFKAMDVHRPGG